MQYFSGVLKNQKPYLIRDLEASDTANLLNYINTLSLEQTYILLQGEQKTLADEEIYVQGLLEKMLKNQAIALVIESEGKIIAHGTLCLRTRVESHVGSISISLAQNYRGQGIGKQFLTKLIDLGKSKLVGLKIIELGVFGNNDLAIHLYESLGFKQYGSLPGGIFHKGAYVDHLQMFLKI